MPSLAFKGHITVSQSAGRAALLKKRACQAPSVCQVFLALWHECLATWSATRIAL